MKKKGFTQELVAPTLATDENMQREKEAERLEHTAQGKIGVNLNVDSDDPRSFAAAAAMAQGCS